MSGLEARDWQQQADFIQRRFDSNGVWIFDGAGDGFVVARRPRCALHVFTWREWLSMPAHEENPVSIAIRAKGDAGQ